MRPDLVAWLRAEPLRRRASVYFWAPPGEDPAWCCELVLAERTAAEGEGATPEDAIGTALRRLSARERDLAVEEDRVHRYATASPAVLAVLAELERLGAALADDDAALLADARGECRWPGCTALVRYHEQHADGCPVPDLLRLWPDDTRLADAALTMWRGSHDSWPHPRADTHDECPACCGRVYASGAAHSATCAVEALDAALQALDAEAP